MAQRKPVVRVPLLTSGRTNADVSRDAEAEFVRIIKNAPEPKSDADKAAEMCVAEHFAAVAGCCFDYAVWALEAAGMDAASASDIAWKALSLAASTANSRRGQIGK